MFEIGITDHLEGPRGQPSAEIYRDVGEMVMLADDLGARYAWFAEHHIHAHYGHLPSPLLFALHLAGRTRRIQLGTAIICLNLHQAVDVAEQVAVADELSGGRMAVGFGSGSTPQEVKLFGKDDSGEDARHVAFEQALRAIREAWRDQAMLPRVRGDLAGRCWVAVNSTGAARIAGKLRFNVLFSHLRTIGQYREYAQIYRAAGGSGLIAANRPVFVGKDDASAFEESEPALRTLWRRFQSEGKIPASIKEPDAPQDLCNHPINFIVGGPEKVARELAELHRAFAFDVANVEVRWAALTHPQVIQSLRRMLEEVSPRARSL